MRNSEETGLLDAALLELSKEIISIKRDTTNAFKKYKYATLDGILDVLRPLTSKHGLVARNGIRFGNGSTEPPMMVTKRIVHVKSGEWIEADFPMPNGLVTPQDYGSALTYARKYLEMLMYGVHPDDDNDGQELQPVSKPPVVRNEPIEEVPWGFYGPDEPETERAPPKKQDSKSCNKCGAPIWFKKNESNGKWDLLNAKGELHYKECRK